MHDVIIFRPTKTPTQSGQRRNTPWRLVFHAPSKISVDPIMRWIEQIDTNQEVTLTFDTKEAALLYAKNKGLRAIVQEEPPVAPLHTHTYQEHLLKPHMRS